MSNEKVFSKEIYIHNIILTTKDDIPFKYRSKYNLNSNIYLKLRQFVCYECNREIDNTLYKMEELLILAVLHREFPEITKEFNRLVDYETVDETPANFKQIIDCV